MGCLGKTLLWTAIACLVIAFAVPVAVLLFIWVLAAISIALM